MFISFGNFYINKKYIVTIESDVEEGNETEFFISINVAGMKEPIKIYFTSEEENLWLQQFHKLLADLGLPQ